MRIVDTQEYLHQVCAMLAEGRTSVPVPVAGNSMCPFLHPGDTVWLDLPEGTLRKGDIVLFTRASGQYILHRIHGEIPGGFLLLGDNQTAPEPVPAERIRAIVTRCKRGDKLMAPGNPIWWFFARIWPRLVPIRRKLAVLVQKRKGNPG